MKTRTCKRCKGKGRVTSGVLHQGVPGRCYACDGSGEQRWETADDVNAIATRLQADHLKQLEGQAALLKADVLRLSARLTSLRPEGRSHAEVLLARKEAELEDLRQAWRTVKQQKPVTRGRWVAR